MKYGLVALEEHHLSPLKNGQAGAEKTTATSFVLKRHFAWITLIMF